MTHRLEDLDLIPSDTWDRLQEAGFKPRAAQRLLGFTFAKTGKPRLPLRYVALSVRAFEAGELSEGQLAIRLMSDRVETRRLVEEASVEPVLRNGEFQQLEIDLGLELVSKAR
jgi:hypothetical protein